MAESVSSSTCLLPMLPALPLYQVLDPPVLPWVSVLSLCFEGRSGNRARAMLRCQERPDAFSVL